MRKPASTLLTLYYNPVSGEWKVTSFFGGEKIGEALEWRLHPLIHTGLVYNLKQYVGLGKVTFTH